VGEGLERLHKGGEAEGEQEDEGQNAAHHVDTVPAEGVLEAGVLAQLHAVIRYLLQHYHGGTGIELNVILDYLKRFHTYTVNRGNCLMSLLFKMVIS
jgi:hypothetical protein